MMKLYNSLTKKKEEFKTINEGKVGMYVCGPTVYDHCHLGHARGYIAMDILRKYLEYSGYEFRFIMNYTDVGHMVNNTEAGEDKVEKKAKAEKIDPLAIANKYIESCKEDFQALNIKPANFYPRPTQYIAQIIKFVEKLIAKGYAYEVNGSVYFSVEKFPDYGKLSGKKTEDLQSGARIEINPEKKNPLDFALWIKAPIGHILKWESPWGTGYPGWHIECSVMSFDLLGETTFDIHGGGNENAFPHNENEIAQSEASLGEKMANYWTLWNMVNVDGVKMSKSLGNFTTIKDALKNNDAMTIRLWAASSNYRSLIDFNENSLNQAKVNLESIDNFYTQLFSYEPKIEEAKLANFTLDTYKQEFTAAMDDDLNTPKALAVILKLVSDGNKMMAEKLLGNPTEVKLLLEDFAKVLGLILEKREIPEEITQLAEESKKARDNKNFATSDKIREEAKKRGYDFRNTKDGIIISPSSSPSISPSPSPSPSPQNIL